MKEYSIIANEENLEEPRSSSSLLTKLQRAGSRLERWLLGGESWTHHVISFQTDVFEI